MSINKGAQDISERLSALGLLAVLCPPGDEEEIMVQIELRNNLLVHWPTPILVEGCRRLALTWTWPKMPLPGDINKSCGKVVMDLRKAERARKLAIEQQPHDLMPIEEAKKLLSTLEKDTDSDNPWESLANRLLLSGLKKRIALGPIASSKRLR